MTMSRVKDTAELFVSTFELNLAGTRLVQHSRGHPLQLHNCRSRRSVLDGRYCKSGQGTAYVRPPQPSQPQVWAPPPKPASGVIQEPQSHDCNAGIIPWVPTHFMRSVLADFCSMRRLMVDHSTIEIKMRRLYRFFTVLKSN